jgi:hypothetical protein
MVCEEVFARLTVALFAKPELGTLGEFFREIGEDFGEYLTATALGPKDAGNDDKFTR